MFSLNNNFKQFQIMSTVKVTPATGLGSTCLKWLLGITDPPLVNETTTNLSLKLEAMNLPAAALGAPEGSGNEYYDQA